MFGGCEGLDEESKLGTKNNQVLSDLTVARQPRVQHKKSAGSLIRGPGAFQYRSYQSILKGEAILAPVCMALIESVTVTVAVVFSV